MCAGGEEGGIEMDVWKPGREGNKGGGGGGGWNVCVGGRGEGEGEGRGWDV